jgi:hypothetical protein
VSGIQSGTRLLQDGQQSFGDGEKVQYR